LIPSRGSFLTVFFSNRTVISDRWCRDEVILIWDKVGTATSPLCQYYIMSPKTYSDYNDFHVKIVSEMPLLMELK
jgi:hypothetical protein